MSLRETLRRLRRSVSRETPPPVSRMELTRVVVPDGEGLVARVNATSLEPEEATELRRSLARAAGMPPERVAIILADPEDRFDLNALSAEEEASHD